MQTTQISFKKSGWLLLPFSVLTLTLLVLSSCNAKKEEKKNEKAELTTVSADVSCLTLTQTQLSTWFPKYSNPDNPEKDKITVLKFYVYPVPGSDAIEVKVRGYNSSNSTLGSAITLGTGVACGVDLPPYFTGQSYDINLSDLGIINPADGKLVEHFSKIVLRPSVYKEGTLNFLKFDADILIGNAPVEERPILPCPPCPNCRPKCDTMINSDTIPRPARIDTGSAGQ